MKHKITSEVWLVLTTTIYALIGVIDLFVYHFVDIEYVQAAWIIIMMLPIIIPMPRWFDITPFWKQ